MPDGYPTPLEVLTCETGCLVRVMGRGTMRESRLVHQFIERYLDDAATKHQGSDCVTLDLSLCERLDSTFLGALVDLHKRYNQPGKLRFIISAPTQVQRSLLGVARLDRILATRTDTPGSLSQPTPLTVSDTVDPGELGAHVLECHRRLAEQGGPSAEAFARVADVLEQELNARVRS
jgi:anti-anti-sigma regulatory factor